MYKQFFGLTRNPFEISPDPRFLVHTSRHNEALANLYYGVRSQKGFVVVTGEVGTGKTLLVRCLLNALNRDQITFAFLFNPRLSVTEFFQYIMGDFGIPTESENKSTMLRSLNTYLIERYRRGMNTVLIVDEAQHLEWDLFEEIRLLTNLETSQQKLLQIILVGQPELQQKLDTPKLRQLKQRISLRCHLQPLVEEEMRRYVYTRLELAGDKGRGQSIFPESTLASIHMYSSGIPRLINTLCENLLIAAYAKQSPIVTSELVEEVATDFQMYGPFEHRNNEQSGSLPENGKMNNYEIIIGKLNEILSSKSKKTQLQSPQVNESENQS